MKEKCCLCDSPMKDGHCTGDPNGCVMTPPAVKYEPKPAWKFWRLLWLTEPLPTGRWKFYHHNYWEPPFRKTWFAVGRLAFHVWTA